MNQELIDKVSINIYECYCTFNLDNPEIIKKIIDLTILGKDSEAIIKEFGYN